MTVSPFLTAGPVPILTSMYFRQVFPTVTSLPLTTGGPPAAVGVPVMPEWMLVAQTTGFVVVPRGQKT